VPIPLQYSPRVIVVRRPSFFRTLERGRPVANPFQFFRNRQNILSPPRLAQGLLTFSLAC
jgi:hypothetical protein